jgi:hypothetical protein
MRASFLRRPTVSVFMVMLTLGVSGCYEGMKWHPVYNAALIGGVVGVIVGHQYDEDCKGAAIGAAIGALGCFLDQADDLALAEDVVVEVASENGSIVPVVLKKKEGIYLCPNGESYRQLPSQEQLRIIFGL